MDESIENGNDGTFDGEQFFECEDGTGTFVKSTRIKRKLTTSPPTKQNEEKNNNQDKKEEIDDIDDNKNENDDKKNYDIKVSEPENDKKEVNKKNKANKLHKNGSIKKKK